MPGTKFRLETTELDSSSVIVTLSPWLDDFKVSGSVAQCYFCSEIHWLNSEADIFMGIMNWIGRDFVFIIHANIRHHQIAFLFYVQLENACQQATWRFQKIWLFFLTLAVFFYLLSAA